MTAKELEHSHSLEDSSYSSEFPIKRPVENFGFDHNHRPEPTSWFETNKHSTLLALTTPSDDLRFNRQIAAGMLSEAWDRSRFMQHEEFSGADDVDRLFQINWLQYWSTFIGLLSATDVRTIRVLSEHGQRKMVLDHFSELVGKKHVISTLDNVAEKTQTLASSGKLVGIFHGAFAPPTWFHLCLANYYHQLCDVLIIGIDNDELVQARKGEGKERYPFIDKYSVWCSYENVVDYAVEVPSNIFRDGDYVDKEVVNYYKKLGVGIVFFNKSETYRERRLSQIRKAGAIPFDEDVFGGKVFRSSQLMELKESGSEYFEPMLNN